MRLVADHDRVGVRDLPGVAHEPLIGLDGHRSARRRLVAVAPQQRPRDTVAIAAVAQLAEELVHEVAAVSEDQDAAGARSLGEAERGHGLAGPGRMLEPEAPAGARVLQGGVRRCLLLGLLGRVPVERLLVGELVALQLDLAGGQLLGRHMPVAARAVPRHEQLGRERDQRAGERVHLMRGQHGAVHQVGLVLGQHPLESQRERVVAPPSHGGLGAAGVELGQRGVQRGAAGGALGESRSRRPPLRARTARARTPRRAPDPRRTPARMRPRSFCQPR